ncbi:tumor necrosis factor receptor superfamily member 4 [Triplophysa dalaica]|uniref:tumor necrosis factor receptor superfamily member 4 n=1 Tax=Triplophysa dalaica TaxID=1582913 RepID=UPI0024DFACF4|nr:tumor necrosis factor receptor superfamily member 4 [Triplophysa dalaica]
MFRHIEILSALFCFLLLYHNVNTKLCPAGQRNVYGQDRCEDCPAKQYNPNEGDWITCRHCSKCGEGSEEEVVCNLISDTRCRCKTGFKPVDEKKKTFCICEEGYGLDSEKNNCMKCPHGFFSNKQNGVCKKWTECKSGIKIPGNNTSDAICKNASKTITTSYIRTDVHTGTSTSTPMNTITSNIAPSITAAYPKDRFNILWLVLVFGVILLLIGLLYHKDTHHCILNKTKLVSRKESSCKKPVEESGEKCLSLLV